MISSLLATFLLIQVLYVPDNDELDRSLPKSAPPNLTHPNLETLTSSVESENIVRSSSLSYHLPESNTEFEQEGDVMVESGTIHDTNEVFEEVTSTHLVLVSRYISDDQVKWMTHAKLHFSGLYLSRAVFVDG